MKTLKLIYLLSLFLLIQACANNENLVVKDIVADSKFLIIPVEDKAPETKFSIVDENGIKTIVSYIRIAQDTVDYRVKYPIETYKGKNIKLHFEGDSIPKFGIGKVYQADSLLAIPDEKYRPGFHFSPEYGWANDPNGMVYFDGEYHLFYQFNPYGTKWGNMHWGHAVSKDLISWDNLGYPIAPDKNGYIFSGSAIIDKNNTAGFGKDAMIAIFTSAGETQSQSIAYSTDKGRTFTKYEGNPVIKNPGNPDFRDPKVSWNDEISKWVMALATKQTITFYSSSNLKDWEKLSEFGEGIGSHGGVWECPDLFPLQYDGKTKWVLIVSINPGGPNGGSATQYFIGDFDGKTFRADALPYPLWMDYGRDNYAGVTWSNIPENDGRKIFMGWMSNWDYANNVPTKNFRSAMTVARELKIANNGKHLVVSNYPVSETKTLRALESAKKDVVVEKEVVLSNLLDKNKGTYEIEMTLKPQNAGIFGFMLQNSKNEELEFRFDMTTGFFSIHRHKSGLVDFEGRFAAGMNAPLVKKDAYKVRVLVDKASAEIFINEGELALTTIFFPTEVMNKLKFYTNEGKFSAEHIKIYQIK